MRTPYGMFLCHGGLTVAPARQIIKRPRGQGGTAPPPRTHAPHTHFPLSPYISCALALPLPLPSHRFPTVNTPGNKQCTRLLFVRLPRRMLKAALKPHSRSLYCLPTLASRTSVPERFSFYHSAPCLRPYPAPMTTTVASAIGSGSPHLDKNLLGAPLAQHGRRRFSALAPIDNTNNQPAPSPVETVVETPQAPVEQALDKAFTDPPLTKVANFRDVGRNHNIDAAES